MYDRKTLRRRRHANMFLFVNDYVQTKSLTVCDVAMATESVVLVYIFYIKIIIITYFWIRRKKYKYQLIFLDFVFAMLIQL